MRKAHAPALIIVLLLLLAGNALALGSEQPYKSYLPNLNMRGGEVGNSPDPVTPVTVTPVTVTPVTVTPVTVTPVTVTPVTVTPEPVTPEPVTPVPPDYNGVWWGTTTQGLPIGFTVGGNAVSEVVLGYIAGGGCTVSGTITETLTPATPILNAGFSNISAGSTAYELSTTFSSEITATGTLTITYTSSFPSPSCTARASVTWTALKGAPRPNTGGLTALLRINNDTGGSLSFSLTGPTTLSSSVGTGSHYFALSPGSYSLTAVAGCGTETVNFNVSASSIYTRDYFCIVTPASAGLATAPEAP